MSKGETPVLNGNDKPEICDFCSSPDLFFAYLASDFAAVEVAMPHAHATFVLDSLGAWVACRECTRLIESELWEELVERSFRAFRETRGTELVVSAVDENRIKSFIRDLHAQFRKYRRSGVHDAGIRSTFAAIN